MMKVIFNVLWSVGRIICKIANLIYRLGLCIMEHSTDKLYEKHSLDVTKR